MSSGANPVRQGVLSPRAVSRGRRGATGPRTAAGKRSSLNRLKKGLCPFWVMRDLAARREDPEAFRRLHRELIAWLGPVDARTRVIVETLAEVWWEKLRRKRNWVGAGAPDTGEIDRRIDDLLQRFVQGVRPRNRKWRYRMEQSLGAGLRGPAVVRFRLEQRLPSLGGKPPARRVSELDSELTGLLDLLRELAREGRPEPQP